MITRSKYKLVRFLPLAVLLIVAGFALLFRNEVRLNVTRLLVLVPHAGVSGTSAGYQTILYQKVVEENARLSSLLSLPRAEVIAAGRVVAHPPRTLYDTLVVAIEPRTAVRRGDLVFFEGILLGTASSVTRGSTSVVLYSSPGASTEVKVGEPTAIVVMKGLGGGAFTFEVPAAVSLEPSDLVTSAATDAVIAIVRSVSTEEGSASVRVYASAPVSMSDLDLVEFVHPY